MLKNISLSIFSVIFILLIIEILFRVFFSFNMSYNMEMHKYALSLKERSSISGLSHEHKPNSSKELMGVNISINDLGMRDDYLLADSLKYKEKVLVLGSSITMGWGVDNENVFTSLLQNELNKDKNEYNIINSGIGNYNTKFESILFKKNFNLINPNSVILHYYLNDAEIISNKSSNFIIKYSYFAAFSYLILQQVLYKSKEYDSLGEYYLNMYDEENPGWIDAQNSILAIKKICDDNNIPLLVLVQPDLHNLSINSDQKKCHNIINDFLNSKKIKFIDLFENYRDTYENSPQELWVNSDDPHPNKFGHEIIYKSLLNYFNK
tara:strand:+ start:1 stop:966 length:966 start_codon:yes stop_codon:yes gene_type:complete